MDDEWDEYAQSWDRDPGPRAYAEAAFGSLLDVLRASDLSLDGARVLDFGCGTGLLIEHLAAAGASVLGVDTSPGMLGALTAKIARHGWTTVDTAAELPDHPARFDLIVCSSVCAFLDDHPGTVAELAARLEAGGLFVQWDWERIGDDGHGLTRSEIDDALTAAGLTEVVVDAAFTIEVDGQAMTPLLGHGRRAGPPPATRSSPGPPAPPRRA